MPRSSFYYRNRPTKAYPVDRNLEACIREIIDENPLYGLRFIMAIVRNGRGIRANRKKIHRIIRLNNWQVQKKPKGHRLRVKGLGSRISTPDSGWAIDATHIFCGREGWCHLTAIIDCCDRSIAGWRLSRSGIAKIAAGALEDALRPRKVRPGVRTLHLRSDNGLVFGSKVFPDIVKKYKISPEFITPYTPEQNGMIERFFKTIKEECIWLNRFNNIDEAFEAVASWIDKYHTRRPHSALNYLTPEEYRRRLVA